MRYWVPIALSLWAASAAAQEECKVSTPLEGQRLLRRLSLDLRAGVPSRDEIEAQRGRAEVSDEVVDALLSSREFLQVMRRYHASLLWPNIDQVQLVPDQNVLMPVEVAPGDNLWLSPLRSVFMRTISGQLYGLCDNTPARFDAEGRPIAEPVTNAAGEIVAYREGFVMVEPWWAPGTQIKVCAFDAQPAERAPLCPGPAERFPFVAPVCEQIQAYADSLRTPFTGQEVDCNSPFAFLAAGCGCGPNLRYCQSTESLTALRTDLLDQELRLVDAVIRDDRPYHEVLTAQTVDMSGRIAHYLRHQSRLNIDLFGDPDASSPIADTAPGDLDRWVPVTRGGRHAGVLTMPGYLLRFGSNRGRAHRFYNAFECSSFIPSGALPSPSEPCSQHEDLTQRCGCNSCHTSLEPMAAAWGRFAEYGFAPLDDAKYPAAADGQCRAPFASVERLVRCLRFYEADPVGDEIPYAGMLHGYVFRTPEQVEIIEAGPRALADAAVSSGSFATCTVRRMWTHFMRRPPTPEEEQSVVPALVADFTGGGYRLRALVKAIVDAPAYRRLP